jgi:hypothetical protein
VFVDGYIHVITGRNHALECRQPVNVRRRDSVQEVIKNEHREERKRQNHVLPDHVHLVFSWHCNAELFAAESLLLWARLD